MTHDELLAKILEFDNSCNTSGSDKDVPKSYNWDCYELHSMAKALRVVVELCKEAQNDIEVSGFAEGIIEAIEKELK
jgi:hypothetical protein